MSGRSGEATLLLLLARGAVPAEIEEQARSLLRQGLAWDLLVSEARAQGVLPLLTRNLSRLGFLGVPAEVRGELEVAYQRNAVRNTLLARELSRLFELFGGHGVPVIPLKGPLLAESLYGDASLRMCADLDVLVPRGAVGDAFELLLVHGYDRADRYPVELADVDFLVRNTMEYGFRPRPPAFPYLLELHWDIAWRWRADSAMVEDIWAEARPRAFGGVQVLVLSAEWELLYLAVHAARHRWQGLKWLADIHEVCTRARFDWARVVDKAHRFGLERALALSLSACHALFGTPLPRVYSGHRVPSWLPLYPASAPLMGEWRQALQVRRLFQRPQDRLRYLARIALRPTLGELELVRLPLGLRLLYYPLRLARLAITSACAARIPWAPDRGNP
jgi:hypothetical protein